jgi:hypothetical protein
MDLSVADRSSINRKKKTPQNVSGSAENYNPATDPNTVPGKDYMTEQSNYV